MRIVICFSDDYPRDYHLFQFELEFELVSHMSNNTRA